MEVRYHLDPVLWAEKDTEWHQLRRKEWESVAYNLSKDPNFNPAQIEELKNYFLTGEVNPLWFDQKAIYREEVAFPFHGLSYLFMQFWFHPSPSEDTFRHLITCHAETKSYRGLSKAITGLSDGLFRPSFIEDCDTEYGYLGGREEFLVPWVTPEYTKDGKYEFDDGTILRRQLAPDFAAKKFVLCMSKMILGTG